MKRFALPLFLTLTMILAACAPSQASTNPPSATSPSGLQPVPVLTSTAAAPSSATDANAPADLTRSDQQGSVTVDVTPLNLSNSSDKIEFDVVLNTHSGDLSMDLATLATLTTDAGVSVQATLWDAPRGGHHVDGKLIFPELKDGKSILGGASKLTLTIVNVDASSRIFVWQLK